jgi:hypothetical protein
MHPTFLFNVVDDPMERANLKDRQKDVYDRLQLDWYTWNETMLPEVAGVTPTTSAAMSSPTTSA